MDNNENDQGETFDPFVSCYVAAGWDVDVVPLFLPDDFLDRDLGMKRRLARWGDDDLVHLVDRLVDHSGEQRRTQISWGLKEGNGFISYVRDQLIIDVCKAIGCTMLPRRHRAVVWRRFAEIVDEVFEERRRWEEESYKRWRASQEDPAA